MFQLFSESQWGQMFSFVFHRQAGLVLWFYLDRSGCHYKKVKNIIVQNNIKYSQTKLFMRVVFLQSLLSATLVIKKTWRWLAPSSSLLLMKG